jgi:hypothetical protein
VTDRAPGDDVGEPLLGDETTITEITIQPDGRIYVFGTSRQVLEVLENLRPDDLRLRLRLDRVRQVEARQHAGGGGGGGRDAVRGDSLCEGSGRAVAER